MFLFVRLFSTEYIFQDRIVKITLLPNLWILETHIESIKFFITSQVNLYNCNASDQHKPRSSEITASHLHRDIVTVNSGRHRYLDKNSK